MNKQEADSVAGWVLIVLAAWAILGLAASCHADDWFELEHDLAHYGAGTMVAEGIHLLDCKQKPWVQCVLETGGAFAANVAYKKGRNEWADPALNERLAWGTLGGFAFYKFNF